MSEVVPHSLWCDGGVIKKNPSKLGGTWCYCWVDNQGRRLHHKSGIVTPEEASSLAVTNNQTELLAALMALESVPKGWEGVLHTDSLVTLRRMTDGRRFNGIPQEWRLRALELRRERKYKVTLVAGHPTKKELQAGIRERNGLITSVHNCFCDQECTRLAADFVGRKV